MKWPHWAGTTRRSGLETLVAITPHMVKADAPEPSDKVMDWLRTDGYVPGSSGWSSPPDWLDRWSIPLDEISPRILEQVLSAITTRRDGKSMSAAVARLPTARYGGLFACVGLAGLRPSEAISLRSDNLDLPDKGWGLARVSAATTDPGARFTTDGETIEEKGLKHRAGGSVREVPLPRPLVDRLRTHLERWNDNVLFLNANGKPMTTGSYNPIWRKARETAWADKPELAKTTVYDLRHAAATMMLRAGVPPAEVARRLGHSIDVLLRVYAGVLVEERERSNEMIDAELRRVLGS